MNCSLTNSPNNSSVIDISKMIGTIMIDVVDSSHMVRLNNPSITSTSNVLAQVIGLTGDLRMISIEDGYAEFLLTNVSSRVKVQYFIV